MNFNQLKAFEVVAKEKSLTKAAKVLGTTQPNVTFHIRHLEQHLGFKVLERTNKKVTVSSKGVRILEYTHAIIDVIAALEKEAARLRAQTPL